MRTTVELPADLLRLAKSRSAERGESLKSLLTRALAAELQIQSTRADAGTRVRLPLFGGVGAPARVSNADLERALSDADVSTVQRTRMTRRRSRVRR